VLSITHSKSLHSEHTPRRKRKKNQDITRLANGSN